MKNLLFAFPRSPRSSVVGTVLSLTWTFRLLTLLVAILAMHLWISPTIVEPAAHSSPASTVAVTAPLTGISAREVATQVAGPAAMTGTTVRDGHGAVDGSLCEHTCPNGHSMLEAMCMIALLLIGIAGFLGLRSVFLRGILVRRGPPVLTYMHPSRPQPLSLVQLSISRT